VPKYPADLDEAADEEVCQIFDQQIEGDDTIHDDEVRGILPP
jgi:isopentenyldiphosphate isomerase